MWENPAMKFRFSSLSRQHADNGLFNMSDIALQASIPVLFRPVVLNTCSRFRFHARLTSFHSAMAFSSPRRMN